MSVDRKYIWFNNRFQIKNVIVDEIELVPNYPDNPSVGEFYYDTASRSLYICDNSTKERPDWKGVMSGEAELVEDD